MSADFQTQLERYAELLVGHGVNVQPGQIVNIGTEAIHRDFAVLVARAAYKRGAKLVDVDLGDQRLLRSRIEFSKDEHLEYVPGYVTERLKNLVDSGGCTMRILGPENPDILSDLCPKKLNDLRLANYKATKYFYDEGINKSRVHWCVASAASEAWGAKVFPELSGAEAKARLWQEIFKITRSDQPDCMEQWTKHNALFVKNASKRSNRRRTESGPVSMRLPVRSNQQ